MPDRNLIVRLLGDASSLKNTYNEAIRAAKNFGNVQAQEVKREEDNLLRLKAKRAQSLGPLRIGAATLAGGAGIFAAIQGLRALTDGLKVTGDEAFTTEGRIKNLASALASGDLVGGLAGLAKSESNLAPDLEKAVAALRQMRDEASRITLQDVVDDSAEFAQLTVQMQAGMRALGLSQGEVTAETEKWVRELRDAAAATVDLETVFKSVFAGIETVLKNATTKAEKAFNDAARAREKMLSGLSTLPPGIGAAIAREQGPEGSQEGLLKVLRVADAKLLKQIEELRTKTGRVVSEKLRAAQLERNAINAQIAALLAPPPPSTIPRVSGGADKQADAIRREKERLKRLTREAAELAAQQREFAAQIRQQGQFRALGLTEGGDTLTPTIANLQKQLKSLTDKVAGTNLDTAKTRGLLARIRKVLSDPLDKATEETRAKIKELFDSIRSGFEEEAGSLASKGPLTKTSGLNTKKILEGLGLDQEQSAEIRSRLSGFNTAGRQLAGNVATRTGGFVGGAAPIVVQSTTNLILDGALIARAVTKNQQKTRRRNPPQKRGPNRIGGV